MTVTTKVIISAALVALLSAPASARFDSDEGILSAYPRFQKERTQMTNGDWARHFVNRPVNRR